MKLKFALILLFVLAIPIGVALLLSGSSQKVSAASHNSVTIRYEDWDDRLIRQDTVSVGQWQPAVPTEPTRQGYRFLQWYDAKGLSIDFMALTQELIDSAWEQTGNGVVLLTAYYGKCDYAHLTSRTDLDVPVKPNFISVYEITDLSKIVNPYLAFRWGDFSQEIFADDIELSARFKTYYPTSALGNHLNVETFVKLGYAVLAVEIRQLDKPFINQNSDFFFANTPMSSIKNVITAGQFDSRYQHYVTNSDVYQRFLVYKFLPDDDAIDSWLPTFDDLYVGKQLPINAFDIFETKSSNLLYEDYSFIKTWKSVATKIDTFGIGIQVYISQIDSKGFRVEFVAPSGYMVLKIDNYLGSNCPINDQGNEITDFGSAFARAAGNGINSNKLSLGSQFYGIGQFFRVLIYQPVRAVKIAFERTSATATTFDYLFSQIALGKNFVIAPQNGLRFSTNTRQSISSQQIIFIVYLDSRFIFTNEIVDESKVVNGTFMFEGQTANWSNLPISACLTDELVPDGPPALSVPTPQPPSDTSNNEQLNAASIVPALVVVAAGAISISLTVALSKLGKKRNKRRRRT